MADGMITNKLIYFRKSLSFKAALTEGNIPRDSLVFIEETGQIYTQNKCFTDYEELKKVLFQVGEGTVDERIQKMQEALVDGASENYNTLKKIEDFLIKFGKNKGTSEGEGIKIEDAEDGTQKISVNVDKKSIIIGDENSLSAGEIDGGEF